MPHGGLSWGAFVRVACVTHGPLGHAWLGHPGAPGHVCRGQPWGPSSRSIARSPPPLGAWLARPGGMTGGRGQRGGRAPGRGSQAPKGGGERAMERDERPQGKRDAGLRGDQG